jgi:hypothetical protein
MDHSTDLSSVKSALSVVEQFHELVAIVDSAKYDVKLATK